MKKKHTKDKLNPKQKRFVKEYCVDSNGTQAAIRAGYSKKTANEQAAQLLAKLNIQEAVKKEQSKIEGRIDITQDKVAQEMAKLAFAEELTSHKVKSLEMLGRHLGMFVDKHIFPDESGKPQKIGGIFSDMERATRLAYLLGQASKRKESNAKRSSGN